MKNLKNIKVGTRLKYRLTEDKTIDCEILFISDISKYERPYLVKYNSPGCGWHMTLIDDGTEVPHDIFTRYFKDETVSFRWLSKKHLLDYSDIDDDEQNYVPALGDYVKIKRDKYADELTGMIGQIFMMFADDNNAIILLRVKKGYGWNIETRENSLPPRFYYKYSGNNNYNFWWTNLDNVKFVKHGKIDNDLHKKEDLLKA